MRPRSTVIFIAMMLIGLALPILYTQLEMKEKRAQRIQQQQQEAPRVVEITAAPPGSSLPAPTAASNPTAVVPAAPVAEASTIAPEHAIYLDRMSGNDMADAIKAWNDLALLYTSEKELVRDFGPAMQDTRLIPFVLSEESWTDASGKSNPYCAAHDVAPTANKQTIGYALQCHRTRLKETGQ